MTESLTEAKRKEEDGGDTAVRKKWDPWNGSQPSGEGWRYAFASIVDPSQQQIIDRIFSLGAKLQNASLDEPYTLDQFNAAIDAMVEIKEGEFLVEDHIVFAAPVIAVVLSALGPKTGGRPIESIEFRRTRGVLDKSGRR